jgi:hypothetical protein
VHNAYSLMLKGYRVEMTNVCMIMDDLCDTSHKLLEPIGASQRLFGK